MLAFISLCPCHFPLRWFRYFLRNALYAFILFQTDFRYPFCFNFNAFQFFTVQEDCRSTQIWFTYWPFVCYFLGLCHYSLAQYIWCKDLDIKTYYTVFFWTWSTFDPQWRRTEAPGGEMTWKEWNRQEMNGHQGKEMAIHKNSLLKWKTLFTNLLW